MDARGDLCDNPVQVLSKKLGLRWSVLLAAFAAGLLHLSHAGAARAVSPESDSAPYHASLHPSAQRHEAQGEPPRGLTYRSSERTTPAGPRFDGALPVSSTQPAAHGFAPLSSDPVSPRGVSLKPTAASPRGPPLPA